ncbi:hypothetical protein FGO68_gene6063 [Halteria grandinella]|uniref:Uncharacterized protein n=1 Tax=Halteria grandinella TaxID=5974 RepID=A0A8J8NM85_HALGN|nr:hypothetical protein FGO68_gene6063 [Halteria grandinella]
MKEWKQKRGCLDRFLWDHKNQEEQIINIYAQRLVGSSYISFAQMQLIRFISICAIVVVWILCFYINVKRSLFYLSFWALSMTMLAQMLLFYAASYTHLEVHRRLTNKKVKAKHRSTLWKWATALYLTAWPFAIAQVLMFATLLGDDQMCQTALKHGFGTWRSVVIVISVYVSPLALIIEGIFNKLVIPVRHMFLPLLCFLWYLSLTQLLSSLLQESAYGLHMATVPFFNFNWADNYAEYQYNTFALARVEHCRRYFTSVSVEFDNTPADGVSKIQPNLGWSLFTGGTMFVLIMLSYLIVSAVTKYAKLTEEEANRFVDKQMGDEEIKVINQ